MLAMSAPRCREIMKTHQKCLSSVNHAFIERAVDVSVYVLAFVLETDISSMRCKNDVTYYTFDDCRDNNC